VIPDTTEAGGREARGLTFRVIAFLTIALLPLGLIAVIQTQEYQREALRRSELAFLALTERAAAAEAEVVAGAIGAAQTLAGLAPGILGDTEICNDALLRVVENDPRFSFVGFIPPDGHIACSTADGAMSLPMTPERFEFLENPRRLISSNLRGPVSEDWVVIVSEPVFDAGRYLGAISISIPSTVLASASGSRRPEGLIAQDPLEMTTFNRRGEILSTLSGEPRPPEDLLPQQELTALFPEAPRAFTGRSRGGDMQTYTITPVVPGEVYVLGVWEPELPRLGRLPTAIAAVLFPLLMWGASLLVASIAMHRLVLVHVQALRSKMRRFGRSRELDVALPQPGTPAEFREMDAEFVAMAESVLRDEAQLEDAVREKNILLKEIHHRVKNNLQLLSSITSMKRRRADTPEARAVLRALQDRILSLAAIHRNLYLSKDMSAVEAGRLIQDIAAQHGVLPGQSRLRMVLEPVVLVPQQAVPLSLLVAEALGGGNTPDDTTPVEIVLTQDAEKMVTVVLESGPPARDADESDATIGDNLIVAFADQLGGTLDRQLLDTGRCRITLAFRALDTVPDALDY